MAWFRGRLLAATVDDHVARAEDDDLRMPLLGLGLIHGVAKLLHTPLMALTNAISSASVVAALIVLSYPDNSTLVIILATVGTALAMSNVISGFMITERILKMFRKGSR